MAEANRDEAEKCLNLSRRFLQEQEYGLALKYAEKSHRLYSTTESLLLMEKIQTSLAAAGGDGRGSDSGAAKTTTKEAKLPQKQPTPAKNHGPSPNSAYSKEQLEEVRRFQKLDKDDFYAVLGVKRDCDEIDIKRAYRKLALQFHPDKNQAPGADEAFKVVSRAFSCLSDPKKRAEYNRFGREDGSTRMGSSGGFQFGHAASSPFAQGFEGELSPEDLFNMFFGGAFGGSGMANPGGATFHFSSSSSPFGPIFAQHFGNFAAAGGDPRRRRYERGSTQPDRPGNMIAFLLQVVPLVIVAVIMYLASFAQSETTDPRWQSASEFISLEYSGRYFPAGPYHTSNLKVPYYATRQFESQFPPSLDRGSLSGRRQRALFELEETIEKRYLGHLQQKCKAEMDDLNKRRVAHQNDPDLLQKLQSEICKSCDELYRLDPNIRK